MLRTWGGIMDMSMDGSPIIDKTHIEGLYLNCGWCYGGFKSTPVSGWTFAHTIAQDQVHELNYHPHVLRRYQFHLTPQNHPLELSLVEVYLAQNQPHPLEECQCFQNLTHLL